MTEGGNVYEAERCLHVQGLPSRLSDPQSYYDYCANTKWFRDRWQWLTDMEITVKQTKHACGWAIMDKGLIYLPPWAQSDLVLLHEVAHFTVWESGDHNIDFRRNYLLLVKHFMGQECWRTLKYGFLAFGLDV